jgi:hypothetical protein
MRRPPVVDVISSEAVASGVFVPIATVLVKLVGCTAVPVSDHKSDAPPAMDFQADPSQ